MRKRLPHYWRFPEILGGTEISPACSLRADIAIFKIIEGPALSVEALLEEIRRDQCHVGLTVLVNRRIRVRSFAGSMAYFDEPELGDYATLKQLIDRMRAKVSERELRDQIDCFERRFTVASLAPVASPWTLATTYAPGLTFDRSH